MAPSYPIARKLGSESIFTGIRDSTERTRRKIDSDPNFDPNFQKRVIRPALSSHCQSRLPRVNNRQPLASGPDSQ